MKYLKILVLIIMLSGCGKTDNTILEKIDAGNVITIKNIPTSWGSPPITEITTTKGIFQVMGVISVINNSTAEIRKYSNGRTYLCLEFSDSCPMVLGI